MTLQNDTKRSRSVHPLELLFLVALIALCIYVWVTANAYSDRGAIWPQMLAIVLVIAIIGDFLIRMFRSSQVASTPAEDADESGEADLKGRPWGVYFAAIVVLAVGAYLFGFVTVVPIFVVLFMLSRGYKRNPITMLLTALILTSVLYIIFQDLANIPLTEGVWLEYELPQFF